MIQQLRRRPIEFPAKLAIESSGNVVVDPKGTAEIATYTTFTELRDRRFLWHLDRKRYLLGKHIADELLADMAAE